MKMPVESAASKIAHPAPEAGKGEQYARECRKTHEARRKFDVIERIVHGLSNGETLRGMCREEGMPGYVTVYEWIKKDEALAERIACAREAGYDCISEEILAIVDDSAHDTYMDDEGNERTNTEVVQRSKLRAEMRLKLLAKWSPKKYGDKLDITQKTTIEADEAEIDRRIKEKLAKALG